MKSDSRWWKKFRNIFFLEKKILNHFSSLVTTNLKWDSLRLSKINWDNEILIFQIGKFIVSLNVLFTLFTKERCWGEKICESRMMMFYFDFWNIIFWNEITSFCLSYKLFILGLCKTKQREKVLGFLKKIWNSGNVKKQT